MKGILILGGYGKVGFKLAEDLSLTHRYKIIIGGRDKLKAQSAAVRLNNDSEGIVFDINSWSAAAESTLASVQVVVVCIDHQDTSLAEFCLRQGKIYISITADVNIILGLHQLGKRIPHPTGLIVTSVGLCPGLSNLMVKHLIDKYPDAEEAEIGILLGLGEKHGPAAIEWTLNNFWKDYFYNGTEVESFGYLGHFKFCGKYGFRKTYRFNFSDQHTLKASYPSKSFSTSMCFDSNAITGLFYILKKIGLTQVLKFQSARRLIVLLIDRFGGGSIDYSLSVNLLAEGKIIHNACILGKEESVITAKVIASIVNQLAQFNTPLTGVADIQSIFSLSDIWPDIRETFCESNLI